MKNLKILLAAVLLSTPVWAQTKTEIQTRIANDYALFDSVAPAQITSNKNAPGALGSKVEISVTGNLSTRDCQYDSYAIFLLPKNSEYSNIENYDVTPHPIYKNASVELSYLPCKSIAMSTIPFHTTIEVVVHDWQGWSDKTWNYFFLGTEGIKLRSLAITYNPSKGWTLKQTP